MEIKLLDMTNQLFISEYNSRVEYSDQFAFAQRSGTMKAPGQERARPFGGALCPGAFIVIVLRLCLQLRSLILRQEVGHAL